MPGFALIMVGLVIAGPWLTMVGARIMARRTSRPGTLIAARRLADDPRAAFRAVSGLVLALFITTVAVALIATQDTKHVAPVAARRPATPSSISSVDAALTTDRWRGSSPPPRRTRADAAAADPRRPGHRRVPRGPGR